MYHHIWQQPFLHSSFYNNNYYGRRVYYSTRRSRESTLAVRLGGRKEYWYPRQNQYSDWSEPSPRSNRRESEVSYSNRSRGGDRYRKDKFGPLRKRSFTQSHYQRPRRGPFVPKQVNSIVVKPSERNNQGKIYLYILL